MVLRTSVQSFSVHALRRRHKVRKKHRFQLWSVEHHTSRLKEYIAVHGRDIQNNRRWVDTISLASAGLSGLGGEGLLLLKSSSGPVLRFVQGTHFTDEWLKPK